MRKKIIDLLKKSRLRVLIFLSMRLHKKHIGQAREWADLKDRLDLFLREHGNDRLSLEAYSIQSGDEKFVGAVNCSDEMVCFIPNSSFKIMTMHYLEGNLEQWGDIPGGSFKWTGGGCYNNSIYAFPRSSNYLLKIDVFRKDTEMIDLHTNYRDEHHYGGVLEDDGCVYQPPRDCDFMQVIDLNRNIVRRIYVTPRIFRLKLRYCGSVAHPNGYIYFIPERHERVIKFNPTSGRFDFIGDFIEECMVFGPAIAADGNIYGFSLYNGILEINTVADSVKMIKTNIKFGCYGTKLGINGRLYGIPGESEFIWEYDIKTGQIKTPGTRLPSKKAKCAGGATSRYGDIFTAPAFGSEIYKIGFQNREKIPDDIYRWFFSDNY